MFGDMLGERRLGAAVQIGNRLRDAAVEFRFLNQERRWNWGAIGGTRARARPLPSDSRRSSTTASRRCCKQSGLPAAHATARGRARRVSVQPRTARRVHRRRPPRRCITASCGRRSRRRPRAACCRAIASSRPAALPTTVAEVGAALVHDTTVFGPTGPLLGSRYRFEIAPAVGDLTYTRVVADYRRYVMPVRPYSMAVRVLHSAATVRTATIRACCRAFSDRTTSCAGIGQDLRYCPPDPPRVCGDELLGSRLLVGNLEVRFRSRGCSRGNSITDRCRRCVRLRRRRHGVSGPPARPASAVSAAAFASTPVAFPSRWWRFARSMGRRAAGSSTSGSASGSEHPSRSPFSVLSSRFVFPPSPRLRRDLAVALRAEAGMFTRRLKPPFYEPRRAHASACAANVNPEPNPEHEQRSELRSVNDDRQGQIVPNSKPRARSSGIRRSTVSAAYRRSARGSL